jgi:Fe-S-cluster-containing hydrogenase component 2
MIMKCLIIYFSLTGNTKKIASAIHKGLTGSGERCDLSTIKQVNMAELKQYDLIGIGSPVWASVPPNVENFITAMPVFNGNHCFVFSTHGASPERFFPRAVELLANRGLTVIGIGDWYGSVYIPNMPKPYFTDGHPDAVDQQEACDFGAKMLELSLKIKAGESLPHELPPPLPPEAYTSSRPRIKMNLNLQECRFPECRLCMDHCPMDAIDLSVSPPIFMRGCQHCYFCEMICPEGAIEADYGSVNKIGILSRINNVFSEALDIAEAEGRFRRLISKNDIGWDTPYYKKYNTHPRFPLPEDEK